MRTRDWAAVSLGCAALGVAIFAVGGAQRWAQAVVALLVAASLIPHFLSRQVFDRRSPLVVLLGLASLLTAIQLLPLNRGLLEHANPTLYSLRADGTALLDLSSWSALTADVPGTLRGLAFFVTLLGVAVLALRVSTSERGRYRVIAAVAALCGLTAIVVGVHELFGITSLYGLYEPAHATPNVLGPLLNENHLGCLMAVGAMLGIGLVMYRRQHSWLRAAWLIVVGACGSVAVASHSRGAALALIAGAAVTCGVMLGQRFATSVDAPRRRHAKFMTSSLPIGVVAICAVVVVVYASAGSVSDELQRLSLNEISAPKSKFAAWRSAATLVEEAPWFGVGRGGFEPTFTRVHPASALATFSHVENAYIQAVVDWGVPGAVLLGLTTIWVLVFAMRRWRDGPLTAAALGAITVVALQSNVDFGVELLGLAAPITAIVATVAYVPLREADQRQRLRARGVRAVHIAALASCAALLLSPVTTSIAEDHRALADEASLTLDDVRPSLERHPLDYYGYALAARIMIRTGDPRAIRLLNHALTLHPTHPGLHHLAARLLLASGRREQATIEYAAALRGSASPQKLIVELLPLFTTEQAAAAIPVELRLDDVVKLTEEAKRPDVTAAWLIRVLDAKPNSVRACEVLYDLSLRRGDIALTELAGKRCAGFEPSHATRLELAEVLFKRNDFAATIELVKDIDTWPGRVDVKVGGWFLLCDSHAGLEHWDEARRCLHRLESSGYLPKERRDLVTNRLEQLRKDRAAKEAAAAGSGSGSALSGSASPPP